MTYFAVDDRFYSHPKIRVAGGAARSLWVMAGSWSSAHLTDGFVPANMLRSFEARKRDADKLVEVGLWEVVDGGWQFHEWLVYQPSKETVLKKRAANAARVARFRAKQPGRDEIPPPDDHDLAEVADSLGSIAPASLHGNAPSVTHYQTRSNDLPRTQNPEPSLLLSQKTLPEVESISNSDPTQILGRAVFSGSDSDARIVGYRWLDEMLGGGGRAPDQHTWVREYVAIGRKSAAERLLVARHAMQTPYITAKLSKATPGHLVKFWAQFVEGPRDTTPQYADVKKPKYAMPEVASRESFAQEAASKEAYTW